MIENLYSHEEISLLKTYFETEDSSVILEHLDGKSFAELMQIFSEVRGLNVIEEEPEQFPLFEPEGYE